MPLEITSKPVLKSLFSARPSKTSEIMSRLIGVKAGFNSVDAGFNAGSLSARPSLSASRAELASCSAVGISITKPLLQL